ncbi:MAG: hypothetical protein HOC71_15960, partial [Candidatus Latescibacteria bacterium]|nr:hypothetical protein [Candidatus Latescibacterota bacterium]
MNRFFPTVAIVLTLVFNGSTAAFAQIGGFSNTGEGGRGLINMQSARTYGKGAVVFGVKSFIMERKTLVIDNLGTAVEKKDFPSIFCVPVAFGLTDEIDLTAALYGFHDARHWKYDSDVTLGYSSPVTGLGASSVGVKIRMPFALDSPVQIAGRFGAVFDTSTEQLDGMNYRWTRKGTDIETSFYETLDITSFLSLHLEQGYVLSGTEAYDDQFIGSAGLELHIRNWWTACCEVNNRTFLGTSPQSIFQAGNDPDRYYSLYGEPAIGNPGYIKDKDADFKEDFLVISPSLIFRLNGNISIDIGAHINIADQVDPKETFQLVGGFTFTTHVKSMIDTDRDGIKNSIDIEPDTPAGFPVDRRGKSLDTDRDGVPDGADREADTPPGAKTDDLGVGVDSDGDGVYDGVDIEPGTPSGYPVNSSGVALDDDGDGVPNPIDREPDTQKGATV